MDETSAEQGPVADTPVDADPVAASTARDGHDHRHSRVFGRAAWEERYRSSERTWSGNPNPVLIEEVADLPPGTVLDAGAGEGGDALWLAARGWTVSAVDLAQTALDRAAAQGGRLGLTVDWRRGDLTEQPPRGSYDLVVSFFLQLPKPARTRLFAHLAGAVAPGGTLLVVGHDPSDQGIVPRPALTEMGWVAAEAAEALDEGWTVQVAEARPRRATLPDGREATIHDAVLRARRSAPEERRGL